MFLNIIEYYSLNYQGLRTRIYARFLLYRGIGLSGYGVFIMWKASKLTDDEVIRIGSQSMLALVRECASSECMCVVMHPQPRFFGHLMLLYFGTTADDRNPASP